MHEEYFPSTSSNIAIVPLNFNTSENVTSFSFFITDFSPVFYFAQKLKEFAAAILILQVSVMLYFFVIACRLPYLHSRYPRYPFSAWRFAAAFRRRTATAKRYFVYKVYKV